MPSDHPSPLPLFQGNGKDVDPPARWFKQFLLSLPESWSDARRIARFELQLDPGSPAEEWFEDLPRIEKASMDDIQAAFVKRWPMKRKTKLSKAQVKQRLKGFALEDDEVAVWDQQHQEFKHVWWAEQVASLAVELGDTEGTCIDYVVENAPRSLRLHMLSDYDSWHSFKQAVRDLPIELLLEARKRGKEDKARDQTIATLQQQLSQLSLQVQTSNGRPTRSNAATAPSVPSSFLSPVTSTAASANPRNASTQGWRQPYTPLTRAQILERAASIPQRPNTEAGKRQYEQDVEMWHAMHGQTSPSIERPYPLKPGTALLGSGECFGCGIVTEPSHTAGTCTATESL